MSVPQDVAAAVKYNKRLYKVFRKNPNEEGIVNFLLSLKPEDAENFGLYIKAIIEYRADDLRQQAKAASRAQAQEQRSFFGKIRNAVWSNDDDEAEDEDQETVYTREELSRAASEIFLMSLKSHQTLTPELVNNFGFEDPIEDLVRYCEDANKKDSTYSLTVVNLLWETFKANPHQDHYIEYYLKLFHRIMPYMHAQTFGMTLEVVSELATTAPKAADLLLTQGVIPYFQAHPQSQQGIRQNLWEEFLEGHQALPFWLWLALGFDDAFVEKLFSLYSTKLSALQNEVLEKQAQFEPRILSIILKSLSSTNVQSDAHHIQRAVDLLNQILSHQLTSDPNHYLDKIFQTAQTLENLPAATAAYQALVTQVLVPRLRNWGNYQDFKRGIFTLSCQEAAKFSFEKWNLYGYDQQDLIWILDNPELHLLVKLGDPERASYIELLGKLAASTPDYEICIYQALSKMLRPGAINPERLSIHSKILQASGPSEGVMESLISLWIQLRTEASDAEQQLILENLILPLLRKNVDAWSDDFKRNSLLRILDLNSVDILDRFVDLYQISKTDFCSLWDKFALWSHHRALKAEHPVPGRQILTHENFTELFSYYFQLNPLSVDLLKLCLRADPQEMERLANTEEVMQVVSAHQAVLMALKTLAPEIIELLPEWDIDKDEPMKIQVAILKRLFALDPMVLTDVSANPNLKDYLNPFIRQIHGIWNETGAELTTFINALKPMTNENLDLATRYSLWIHDRKLNPNHEKGGRGLLTPENLRQLFIFALQENPPRFDLMSDLYGEFPGVLDGIAKNPVASEAIITLTNLYIESWANLTLTPEQRRLFANLLGILEFDMVVGLNYVKSWLAMQQNFPQQPEASQTFFETVVKTEFEKMAGLEALSSEQFSDCLDCWIFLKSSPFSANRDAYAKQILLPYLNKLMAVNPFEPHLANVLIARWISLAIPQEGVVHDEALSNEFFEVVLKPYLTHHQSSFSVDFIGQVLKQLTDTQFVEGFDRLIPLLKLDQTEIPIGAKWWLWNWHYQQYPDRGYQARGILSNNDLSQLHDSDTIDFNARKTILKIRPELILEVSRTLQPHEMIELARHLEEFPQEHDDFVLPDALVRLLLVMGYQPNQTTIAKHTPLLDEFNHFQHAIDLAKRGMTTSLRKMMAANSSGLAPWFETVLAVNRHQEIPDLNKKFFTLFRQIPWLRPIQNQDGTVTQSKIKDMGSNPIYFSYTKLFYKARKAEKLSQPESERDYKDARRMIRQYSSRWRNLITFHWDRRYAPLMREFLSQERDNILRDANLKTGAGFKRRLNDFVTQRGITLLGKRNPKENGSLGRRIDYINGQIQEPDLLQDESSTPNPD